MKKQVIVQRISLTDNPNNLDHQISELCEVNFAAGYTLVSTFVLGTDLVLLFKLL